MVLKGVKASERSKPLEEWTRLDYIFITAGKIPSHNARVHAGTDELPCVELEFEHPRSYRGPLRSALVTMVVMMVSRRWVDWHRVDNQRRHKWWVVTTSVGVDIGILPKCRQSLCCLQLLSLGRNSGSRQLAEARTSGIRDGITVSQ